LEFQPHYEVSIKEISKAYSIHDINYYIESYDEESFSDSEDSDLNMPIDFSKFKADFYYRPLDQVDYNSPIIGFKHT